MSQAATRWWGAFEVDVNRVRRWRIGPFHLWAHRLSGEWRLAHAHEKEPLDSTLELNPEVDVSTIFDDATVVRFATSRNEGLIVTPRLADRSVVTRPDAAFELTKTSTTALYLSTALWIQVRDGQDGPTLLDVPSFRLSDTWFGANTMRGELCYASRTGARLDLSTLPRRPSRAITKIVLVNESQEGFRLERLNLPAANLSLFEDAEGALWTEEVRVERGSKGELARVRIADGPPEEAGEVKSVSGPREHSRNQFVERAVGAFLHYTAS